MLRRDALKAIPALCLAPTALLSAKQNILHDYIVCYNTEMNRCSIEYISQNIPTGTGRLTNQAVKQMHNCRYYEGQRCLVFSSTNSKKESRDAAEDFIKAMDLKIDRISYYTE